MAIVSIISVTGGVGKTTLAANLAAIASQRGLKVLVVEWDPANRLGFHLGVCDRIDEGWVSTCVQGRAWNETAYQNSDNVTFLPFGQLKSCERTKIEQLLIDQPDWLANQLRRIDLGENSLLLLDVERGPSIYMSQAMLASDLALLTLKPSPCFKLEVETVQQEATSVGSSADDKLTIKYLLNFADPTRRAAAENATAMIADLGEDLLPYHIHRDEAVPEALVANAALAEFAPDSQASHDLHGLTSWLLNRCKLLRGKP